jgi:membrane protein
MNLSLIRTLLGRTYSDWNEDHAPRLGAALAFYTLLSLSPLVILAVAVVSLFFDHASAQTQTLSELRGLVGPTGVQVVQSMLETSTRTKGGGTATIISLVILGLGASGVFGELRSALNLIWEVQPKSGSGMWNLVRERILSLGMVISIGFVLLVSLIASAALDVMTKFFRSLLPIPSLILTGVDIIVSITAITILFGLILKYIPETEVQWNEVRVGAVLTALLFTVGKLLLGLYLGEASPGSAYGAAGSLVVTVIWVFYSAQIFYFGAEFTHVYALIRRSSIKAHVNG